MGMADPVSATPLVSVCINTYQHAPFIAQCIESALAQQTTFPFEIIIGEDESSDGTREICKQFAEKHPDKIRLLLHRRADVLYVNGKPTGRNNFMRTALAAKGKYLALCEGDDFWIATDKLQRQVDFMERSPQYSFTCAHAIKVDDNGAEKDKIPLPDRQEFDASDLARANFALTASVMFRTWQVHEIIRRPDFKKTTAGDYFLEVMAAASGPVHYFREAMVAWRIHAGSMWGNKPLAIQLLNGMFAQYLMIRNLPAGHNARAILAEVVDAAAKQLFALPSFDLQKEMQPFMDVPFRNDMLKKYNLHTGKKLKYGPHASDSFGVRLKRKLGLH